MTTNISVNDGSTKFLNKKKTAISGKLILAVYASVIYVYISCTCLSGRLEYNSLFVGLGGWGVTAVRKNFGCKSVDDNMDGLNVYSVVQVGSGRDY